MKTTTFKGWDWSELVEHFKIEAKMQELPEFDGEEPDVDKMDNYRTKNGNVSWSDWWKNEVSQEYKDHIEKFGHIKDLNEEEQKKALRTFLSENTDDETVMSDLRLFIKALCKASKQIDHFHPVWKALLRIKNNTTLVQLTCSLLDHMWT